MKKGIHVQACLGLAIAASLAAACSSTPSSAPLGSDPTYGDGTRFEGDRCIENADCAGGSVACVNGVCAKGGAVDAGQPGPGGLAPRTAAGFWRRVNSALGRETDLAFGRVRDEGDRRVLMCELPPSPVAGLYTGTLNAERDAITWDAKYNLPIYKVDFLEDYKLTFRPVTTGEPLGEYVPGSWRPDSCGYFEVEGEIGLSKWSAWAEALNARGHTVKSVTVDGITIPTSDLPTPQCDTAKLPPAKKSGLRDVSIVVDVNGTAQTVTTTVPQAAFKDGCNRLEIKTGSQCGGPVACVTVGDRPPQPPLEIMATPVGSLIGFRLVLGSSLYIFTFEGSTLKVCPLGGCAASPPSMDFGAFPAGPWITSHQGTLFFSSGGNEMRSCTPSGATCTSSSLGGGGQATPFRLAVANGHLYWLEAPSGAGTIDVRTCPVAGCGPGYPKTVHSEPASPGIVAFAPTTSALFFVTNTDLIRVPLTNAEVANAAGRTVLVKTTCLFVDLRADESKNELYWLERCSSPPNQPVQPHGITQLRSCSLPACDLGILEYALPPDHWTGFALNATHVYASTGFKPAVQTPPTPGRDYGEVWRFAR